MDEDSEEFLNDGGDDFDEFLDDLDSLDLDD